VILQSPSGIKPAKDAKNVKKISRFITPILEFVKHVIRILLSSTKLHKNVKLSGRIPQKSKLQLQILLSLLIKLKLRHQHKKIVQDKGLYGIIQQNYVNNVSK
jgi:hypothetical protein